MLDHIEYGWALLSPLQWEAKIIIAWRRSKTDSVGWVADFVEMSITEEFRDLAVRCTDAMLRWDIGSVVRYGITDEAEALNRNLVILGMATGDPEFPTRLREQVLFAVDAFGRWVEGFREVLSTVEISEARMAETGTVPVSALQLRAMN